jgi:ATP-dependent NAD(P)H-hydrate dehydratase
VAAAALRLSLPLAHAPRAAQADLSHVFCSDAAATAIKSYSPELIVHGCLQEQQPEPEEREAQVEAVCKWFPALTALVVGPGLGRDETLQAVAERIIERAIAEDLPVVIDADGLAIVTRRPALVRGSRWTVLTPNRPEYGRLSQAVMPQAAAAAPGTPGEAEHLAQLCDALGGPTVVRKGAADLISDGGCWLAMEEAGSRKRSGGQGDVLAGSIATLLSWAKPLAGSDCGGAPAGFLPEGSAPLPMLAAYTGCQLTRRFSAAAFARHRRAMTAPDLIEAIGPVFEEFSPAD